MYTSVPALITKSVARYSSCEIISGMGSTVLCCSGIVYYNFLFWDNLGG